MKTLHLLYHELRPEPSRYSYVASCAEFEQHCELFSRLQREAPADSLRPEITFDDGNVSDLQFALPILQKYGLKAHFFITAGWTSERPGYMSAAQLRELHGAGMQIGAHGWSHKLLNACTDTELDQELRGARAKLEEILGARVTTMSLPGGRSNRAAVHACRNAGYARIFTSVPQVYDDLEPTWTTGRLNIRSGATTEWLTELLRPESGVLAALQRADRLKSAAKKVLGDRLYAGLWSVVNREEPDPADTGAPAA